MDSLPRQGEESLDGPILVTQIPFPIYLPTAPAPVKREQFFLLDRRGQSAVRGGLWCGGHCCIHSQIPFILSSEEKMNVPWLKWRELAVLIIFSMSAVDTETMDVAILRSYSLARRSDCE